jgi:uncharacterized protein YdaU (DUF1376 family)
VADYPALPLWTDAYIADTMHMGCLESGAYLHLLMAAWRSPTCTLPDDDKMLGRMARCTPREWAKVRPVVMNFWVRDDETKTWTQKRLLRERDYLREKSEKAKRAAEAKYQKENKTDNADARTEQTAEQSPGTCSEPARSIPPTPIPTPKVEGCVAGASAPEAPAIDETTELEKREVRLICEAFNAEQATHFGDRAPLPHPANFASALRMVRGGATADLIRPIIASTIAKMAFTGKQPLKALSYFIDPVADALAQSRAPMPQGTTDAELVASLPAHLDARRKRPANSFDAAVDAARSLVAGG